VNKILRFAGSGLLLGWLAWKTDWPQVARAFAHMSWGWWLLAVALYVVNQVLSAVRWQWLSRPLGIRRGLGQHLSYYFIGMFFNLVLPTSVGGDVVRAWYLDGGSGKRLAAFLSVFLDRFSGLLVLLAVACVAVACCPLALPPWLTWSVWALVGSALLGITGVSLLAAWLRKSDAAALAPPSGLGGKLLAMFRRFTVGLAEAVVLYRRSPRLLLETTVLSLLVQVGNVWVVWAIGAGLAAPVPASFYYILVPLVALLQLLPISIGGHGVREASMIFLLGTVGVGAGVAVTLSLLWFGAGAAVSLAGLFLYLFGKYPRFEVTADHGPERDHSDQGRAGQSAAAA
jgi:uncharacterized protein (TIRG00374 family)